MNGLRTSRRHERTLNLARCLVREPPMHRC